MSATKLSGPVAGHAAPVIVPLIAVDPVAALPPADAPRPLAQAKTKAPPPAVAPATPPQTGAEIVGKLLAPRASDPDVPLPHPNLAEPAAANAASNRPHIFGRGEEGGGVLGLRVPFPADRGGSTANTRSGSGRSGARIAAAIALKWALLRHGHRSPR